ncbi:hypothetical protein ACFQ1I_19220 [Kitasatospora arboriphila]
MAAAGIFALGSHLYGHRAGTVAAVLWGVLPHAVVESYAYSEALFTALAVWSLYAVVTRRWVWAGAISTLSCLTRPTGMAVAAAVVVAAAWCLVGHLRGRGGDVHWSRPLLGAVLAPLGWLGYVGYVGWARGEWNGYFRVQSAWDSHFDGGITTARWLKAMLIGQGHRSTQLDQVVMVLVVLAAVFLFAVTLVQRHPLPLLVFTATSLLIALGNGAFYAPRARFLVPAVTLLLLSRGRAGQGAVEAHPGRRPGLCRARLRHVRRLPDVPQPVLAVTGGPAPVSRAVTAPRRSAASTA